MAVPGARAAHRLAAIASRWPTRQLLQAWTPLRRALLRSSAFIFAGRPRLDPSELQMRCRSQSNMFWSSARRRLRPLLLAPQAHSPHSTTPPPHLRASLREQKQPACSSTILSTSHTPLASAGCGESSLQLRSASAVFNLPGGLPTMDQRRDSQSPFAARCLCGGRSCRWVGRCK